MISLFNKTCGKKIEKLSSDRMFLLISSIIGFKNEEKEESLIIKEVAHVFFTISFLTIFVIKIQEKDLKVCVLSHNGGGALITNEASKLLEKPSNLNDKITAWYF